MDLYQAALQSRSGASGFYNDNIRLDIETGPVIVRIPIAGADSMDLRIWPEYEVLAAIATHVEHVPRLLHVSKNPFFQVHEFIAGDVVDDIAPRGERVPQAVLRDVVRLFVQLTSVPLRELPQLPPSWPEETDTAGFARLLSDVTRKVHTAFREDYQSLFSALAIPDDPLGPIITRWPELHPRPFSLIHCDVHRKNMIVSGEHVAFLDWELALWGDPVYELAVHLHKMAYQEDEREAVLDGWLRNMPTQRTHGWRRDLDIYLAHERVKSAVVDSVRYAQLISSGSLSTEQEKELCIKLTNKINAAHKVWQHQGWMTVMQVDAALHGKG